MENCFYCQLFPKPADEKNHCMAYSYAKRADGRHWGHYPICADENCPLKHQELLEGAILTCGDARSSGD